MPPEAPTTERARSKGEAFEFSAFDEVLQLIDDKPAGAAKVPAVNEPSKPAVVPPPPMISVPGASDRGPIATVAGPPPVRSSLAPQAEGPSNLGSPLAPQAEGSPNLAALPKEECQANGMTFRSRSERATWPTTMRRGQRQPGPVLLLTRKAVYAQAAVMAGMMLLAFLAGWLIGRGSQPKARTAPAEPAGEPVALEGRVLYSLSPGQSLADERAVVIALPAGKKPAKKIAARGLRPADEDELNAAPSADALRALGGSIARVDESGQFQLVVPRPGNYWLLIISHLASRPDELAIAMSDVKELSGYFASPSELIGQQRYSLSSRRLSGAPPSMVQEFGPTDKL
ncbi:MAG TPA: hypothetical protein PK867_26710 [Pirellulales bacterium]|nr:hypothetical protein [Pirellulales bacterium]